MFGLITKKKLKKELMFLYKEHTCYDDQERKDFYFDSGNLNAVNYIAHKFGIQTESLITSEDKENG